MEIIKPGTKINFVNFRVIALTISALVVALCLIGIFIYPKPNMGIDFVGGAEMQVSFEKPIEMGQLRQAMKELDLGEVKIQQWLELGETQSNKYLIRAEKLVLTEEKSKGEEEEVETQKNETDLDEPQPEKKAADGSGAGKEDSAGEGARAPEAAAGESVKAGSTEKEDIAGEGTRAPQEETKKPDREETKKPDREETKKLDREETKKPETMKTGTIVEDKLEEVFGKDNFTILKTDYVGPKVGKELRDNGIMAIGFAMILLLAYISLRFEFRFALGAVIAIIHDVIITTGVFVWTNKEFNLAIIAALLTIIGYSLNDTIVVFDRIRENVRRLRRLGFKEMINASINETLSRTILTSLTTLVVVSSLWLLGGGAIHDFAFAMLVGILVGTYSSIFVASSFVIWMEDLRERKRTTVAADKDVERSS